MLHTVVMAGGSGTRFWPQSRRQLPKQFLQLGGEHTLIQDTVARCLPLISPSRLWVVTGAVHAAETIRQLPQLPAEQILVEPCPRNTAPCIGLAAIRLLAADPEATMLVVPADHLISPAVAFQQAVERAVACVEKEPSAFVLFGITPSYPATGFGYIQRGEAIAEAAGSIFRVAAFKEKPDLLTAARYMAGDDFFWNCGIFVWKARAILEALAEFEPQIHAGLMRLKPLIATSAWDAALEAEFPQMPSISIDYAVLERAKNVYVSPASFSWDDVGSWHALSRLLSADRDDNTHEGLFCGEETSGCIVRSTSDHLIATVGVKDLIIVHTPTATLVADRRDELAVKKLIAKLERSGLDRFL